MIAPACMQDRGRMGRGYPYTDNQDVEDVAEDCLYLNVWSLSLDANNPVLVTLHGGGYFVGQLHSKVLK